MKTFQVHRNCNLAGVISANEVSSIDAQGRSSVTRFVVSAIKRRTVARKFDVHSHFGVGPDLVFSALKDKSYNRVHTRGKGRRTDDSDEIEAHETAAKSSTEGIDGNEGNNKVVNAAHRTTGTDDNWGNDAWKTMTSNAEFSASLRKQRRYGTTSTACTRC